MTKDRMKSAGLVLLWAVGMGLGSHAWAEDDGVSPEDKAKEIHRLASSDVIYQDQETKAIYYQNMQMIELLKQIRDLLDSRLKDTQTESTS